MLHCTSKTKANTDSSLRLVPSSSFLKLYGKDQCAWQVVDCNAAGSKECHHAKHAANAFDTEKVALMHGIFQLLQIPPSESHPTWLLAAQSCSFTACLVHAICLHTIRCHFCTGPLHTNTIVVHCMSSCCLTLYTVTPMHDQFASCFCRC